MLRSKTCLTDVNVWVALATERHEHHAVARAWFSSLGEGEAAFCRITQMGFLRLLTSPAVMRQDVIGPVEAWRHYRALRRDWRVTFAREPARLESYWMDLMRGGGGASSWTDAYLAAFAIGHGYTLVSFDEGFRRWKQLRFMALQHFPAN